jgi:hypothetical protein
MRSYFSEAVAFDRNVWMDKKIQIFLSSTYEDLKEERDAVSKAILELGDISVGMEMFSAGDEDQWSPDGQPAIYERKTHHLFSRLRSPLHR